MHIFVPKLVPKPIICRYHPSSHIHRLGSLPMGKRKQFNIENHLRLEAKRGNWQGKRELLILTFMHAILMLCKQVKPNHGTPSPLSTPKKEQQKKMPSWPSMATRFAMRSARFADSYHRCLTGKQAAWASKKYRDHRTLPRGIIEDLYKAQLL